MRLKFRKFLSIALTLCMVVGMLPGMSLTAFATTEPQISYSIGEAYKYTSGETGITEVSYGAAALNSTAVSSIDGNVVTLGTTADKTSTSTNLKLIYVPVEVTVTVPANTELNLKHKIDFDAVRVVEGASATVTATSAVYYLGETDVSSDLTFYPAYSGTTRPTSDPLELAFATQGKSDLTETEFSINTDKTISYNNNTNQAKEFTDYFGVMIVIQKASSVKNTMTAEVTFTAEELHGHDSVTFTEWTATDSLPTTAGNYCLANEVILANEWSAPTGETSICLNGRSIAQADNDALSVSNGATLSIYDCGTGGKITHAEGAKGQGVYVATGGTFNLYSGAISGNKSNSSGGGVFMSGGTFNMFGGSITDNETTTYSGGGVCVSGEFNMSGGSITGNKAERFGGGVCHSSGTITVSGKVVIKDNYKTDGTTPSNLYFPSGRTLTVGELAAGTEIGINTIDVPTATTPVVFTKAIDESKRETYKAYFTSDNSAYTIGYNVNGGMQLIAPVTHDHADGTVFDKKWTATGGTISTSGNYYLADNLTATGSITIDSGADVTLCLNGKTLDLGSYYITNNGTLTICDCQTAQGTITGKYGIYNANTGSVEVTGGTVSSAAKYYHGIYNNSTGSVTISGGTVLSGENGSAIYNNSTGTVTVTGGTVTGTGQYCFGITNASTGSVTVTGGTVSGSHNRYGIENTDGGSVTVSGGTVSGGCGIYNKSTASITVTDGKIEARSYGIYHQSTGSVAVTGGTISGNTGIFVVGNATVHLSGGTIKSTSTSYCCIDAQGSDSAVYLSGTVIESAGPADISISGLGGTKIYAHDSTNTTAYSGDGLAVKLGYGFETEGRIVIHDVNDSNKDKFSLVTSSNFILKQSGDNLILAPAHTHSWSSAWTSDGTAHWHECTADGCDITENSQKDSYQTHSAPADDNNCTTAVECATCKYVFTAAKSHSYDNDCDTDCNNLGCTKGNRLANHSFTTTASTTEASAATCLANQKNYVQCDNCNVISDTVTVEVANTKLSHNYTYTLSASGKTITETCDKGCGHSATVTITAPTGTLTYDGTTEFNASITYSSDDWQGGEPAISYTRGGSSVTDTKNAGSYVASITIGGETATVSYTIEKATVTEPTISSKIFNNAEQVATIPTSTLYDVAENNGGVNVGTYGVILRLTDSDNYKWSTTPNDIVERDFEITQATNRFTTPPAIAGWTYGETPLPPTGMAAFGDVEFKYYDSNYGELGTTAPTNAGNYYMKAFVAEGTPRTRAVTPNYEAISSEFVAFTIAKAQIAKPAADTATFTYDGTPKTYTIASNPNYSVSGNVKTNAAHYYVTVTLNDPTNYEWIGDPNASITYDFVINKADYDMSGISFTNGAFFYDGLAHSLEITDVLPTGADDIQVTVSYSGEATNVADGDVTVTAAFATTSTNYNTPLPMTATVRINPKDIAGAEITLGDALTYNAVAQTQTIASAVIDGLTITYTPSGNTGTAAADYTLTITGNGNFTGTENKVWRIAKSTPTIETNPTASHIRNNSQLSVSKLTGGVAKGVGDTELSGTFSWKDGTEILSTIGTARKTVVFTPNDTSYSTVEFDVNVYVSGSGGSAKNSSVTGARCTVKFATKGGSTVAAKTVLKNKIIDEPTEPSRDGFTFDGWYTDEQLTKKYDFTSKVTKSFTLYAKWVKNEKEPDENDTTGTSSWNPFIDVTENDWFHDVIKEAYLSNLVTGTSENTFSPNGDITRGMFVAILWRAEGEPVESQEATFHDIGQDFYYDKAVNWGAKNGIIHGFSETEYAPDKEITREQMAAILWRYAKYKNADVSSGEDTNILSFTDFDKITEYAIPSMQWASGEGIISGKPGGILEPLGNATRAEATAMLVRLLNIIK